eukprot:30721-Pelagococcus_subviridis.AAC.4
MPIASVCPRAADFSNHSNASSAARKRKRARDLGPRENSLSESPKSSAATLQARAVPSATRAPGPYSPRARPEASRCPARSR